MLSRDLVDVLGGDLSQQVVGLVLQQIGLGLLELRLHVLERCARVAYRSLQLLNLDLFPAETRVRKHTHTRAQMRQRHARERRQTYGRRTCAMGLKPVPMSELWTGAREPNNSNDATPISIAVRPRRRITTRSTARRVCIPRLPCISSLERRGP